MLIGLTALPLDAMSEQLIPYNSGTNTGSPPAAWFDGINTGSTAGAFTTAYGKDYGAGAAKVFSKARIIGATTRGTSTNTATATVLFEGSNDGSGWVTLANSGPVPNAQLANWVGTATVANPAAAYRYARVTITNSAGDGNMFLAEIEFYELL